MDLLAKKRNNNLDIIRGVAILLVVLGHTMTGVVSDAADSFLFQVVWSLQMPLFFLISGYTNIYGSVTKTFRDLLVYIGKKTLAYMVPFAVWTWLIRGLLFGKNMFFDLKFLIYNMDNGYWFLFVLWIITLCFGLSKFIAYKLSKYEKNTKFIIIASALMAIPEIVFLLIGYFIGFNFLSMKLLIYYIPFYLIGFIFGSFYEKLLKIKNYDLLSKIFVGICAIVWFVLLLKFNFYYTPDTILYSGIRFISSLCGCVFLCSFIVNTVRCFPVKLSNALQWIGRHTLEIYVMHFLLLNKIKWNGTSLPFLTIQGVGMVAVNYIVAVVVTCLLIAMIEHNVFLSKLLFWKKMK